MSKANEVGVTLAKCSLAWATACFRPNPIRPDLLKTSRSIHLVKMLASQIRDARAYGETEERLYLLDGWREAPTYSARERAALAWTKALTLVAQTRAPDAGPRRLRIDHRPAAARAAAAFRIEKPVVLLPGRKPAPLTNR
jgi:alkylhydroperoxidase family enzyme